MACLHRLVLLNCFLSKKDPTHATKLLVATATSLMSASQPVKLSIRSERWTWFATTSSITLTRKANCTKPTGATPNSSACFIFWSKTTSQSSSSALSLQSKLLTNLKIAPRSYKNGCASLDSTSCAKSWKTGWSSNTTRLSPWSSQVSQLRSGRTYPQWA